MRVKGNVLTQDVQVICLHDANGVPALIDTSQAGCAHVNIPVGGVATVIPATPTAQDIATALLAAFPTVFTQAA